MNGPARLGVLGALFWLGGFVAVPAASLKGRVLHADGNPIADATVSFFPVRSPGQKSLDEARGKAPEPLGKAGSTIWGGSLFRPRGAHVRSAKRRDPKRRPTARRGRP